MKFYTQNETGFAFGDRKAKREERIALLRFTMAQARENPMRIPIVRLETNEWPRRTAFTFQTGSSRNEKVTA